MEPISHWPALLEITAAIITIGYLGRDCLREIRKRRRRKPPTAR